MKLMRTVQWQSRISPSVIVCLLVTNIASTTIVRIGKRDPSLAGTGLRKIMNARLRRMGQMAQDEDFAELSEEGILFCLGTTTGLFSSTSFCYLYSILFFSI